MNTKTSEVLWDLFDLAITGVAGVTRRLALMKQPMPEPSPSAGITEELWSRVRAGQTYIRALVRITVFCACSPLLILGLGVLAGFGWLVAIAGIFWAICTLILLVVATPVGLLLEGILGGIGGIGPRYVRFALGLFLIELLFALFVSVVPIRNNPSAIPIVILASAILGVLGALGVKTVFSQRFIGLIVSGIFLLFTLSFFLPETFKSVMNWGSQLDASLTGRSVSSASSRGRPGLPPGGLMETEQEKKEYEAAVAGATPPVAKVSEKKDLISFPIKLTKGVWSKEVDLFSLSPFRYHWDVFVSDSVRIRFSNRTELVVHPGDTLRVGNRPAVMKFLAFNDSTTVVPSAWNQ